MDKDQEKSLVTKNNHLNQALMHLQHAYPDPSEIMNQAIKIISKEQELLRTQLQELRSNDGSKGTGTSSI